MGGKKDGAHFHAGAEEWGEKKKEWKKASFGIPGPP